MCTVAIAGATGVVGTQALGQLLAHPRVSNVIAVGRRPPSVKHEKLVANTADFANINSLHDALPASLDAAFCCLGSTIRQAGSKEAFYAIDHDAVIAWAQACKAAGASAFGDVSSLGASTSANNFYLRTKGTAEADLAALGFEHLVILRPSMIDDEGTREDFRIAERVGLPLARAAFSLFARRSRYAPVKADRIARAMVQEVLGAGAPGDTTPMVLESEAIQRYTASV